ncbi:MAG TPA: hypothetical protein VMB34_06905 [Acetobacteraceae bacterium]|nr:hypothetical protein [Acetobacteraceae bacterium]
MAFPATDESNPPLIPAGADLSQPDALDLAHQMGLTSGFASLGSAQGWTILPRISGEEEFTDNVNEVAAPRRWDLTTIVAPGVAVLGNSDRAQLRLNYEPDLEIHIREGSQNVLAQQLDAVGTLTLVPDTVFVDIRGVAGTQATGGGIGGLGGLGQPGIGGVTATSPVSPSNGAIGLAKHNLSETSSFSISPYMLYRFGDLATARLSVTATRSVSSEINGFAPMPFVAEGQDAEAFSSLQELAQLQSGDEFDRFRDTFTASGEQGVSSGIGISSSQRDSVNNRIDYQITDSLDVYGQFGWENIRYSGENALRIDDGTWGAGTIYTPNPDTYVSLGYAHQNGVNTATATARYAITARTVLTANFNNGVGTFLEQVANQLNQASVGNNGNLVNAQTGGQLFTNVNALGVETGVYRYSFLTVGLSSVLDRDTLNLSLSHSEETRLGAGAANTSNGVTTGTFSWLHAFSADLTSTLVASYSAGTPVAGANSHTLLAGLSMQYVLSDTVSTFARYNYYDVQYSTGGQSWYQDVFLVGITKQF